MRPLSINVLGAAILLGVFPLLPAEDCYALQSSSTATGLSRLLNPAVSANGLFLFSSKTLGHHDEDSEHSHGSIEQGFQFQEVELQVSSVVDPYTRADIILAMHGGEGIEAEEAVLTFTSLPWSLGLRLGKSFAEFGRHNSLHTHQYPFIDQPAVVREVLGAHGINEPLVELSYLSPLPWYGEFTAAFLNGDNHLFDSDKPGTHAYLGRTRHLWDVTESATLDVGGAVVAGPSKLGGDSRVWEADATVKWSPLRGDDYRKVVLQAEYISALLSNEEEIEPWGYYTQLQYKASRRWWVQARYERFEGEQYEHEAGEENHEKRFAGLQEDDLHEESHIAEGSAESLSFLVAFVPSEFSAVRAQYNHDLTNDGENNFLLQVNFTIGSHPAHRY